MSDASTTIISMKSLEGHQLVEMTGLQVSIAPHVPEIIIGWWLVFGCAALYVAFNIGMRAMRGYPHE